MSVKRRDEAAGIILRFATKQFPDVEFVFYRSPSEWEDAEKAICIYIGREDGRGEYHPISATDEQIKERPGSTLLPMVRSVCETLRKVGGDEPTLKGMSKTGRKPKA